MEIGLISSTSVKQKIVLRLKAAEDDREDGCIDGRELTESDIKAAITESNQGFIEKLQELQHTICMDFKGLFLKMCPIRPDFFDVNAFTNIIKHQCWPLSICPLF